MLSSLRTVGQQLARRTAVAHQPTPAFVVTRMLSAVAALDRQTVQDRVLKVLKAYPKVNASKLTADVKFAELDLDSLDTVEVVMAIEEEFGIEIPDTDADKILSTADAINYISHQPNAK